MWEVNVALKEERERKGKEEERKERRGRRGKWRMLWMPRNCLVGRKQTEHEDNIEEEQLEFFEWESKKWEKRRVSIFSHAFLISYGSFNINRENLTNF